MKKVFVLLLCVLAVFAIVSCKQEPEKESDPTPAPSGDNGAILTVTADTGATYEHADRFQFAIVQPIKENDSVVFEVKLPESAKSIVPRNGKGDYDKFETISIDSLTPDADGWYKIDTDATVDCEAFGITVMLQDEAVQDDGLFVSIRNLKIGGVAVDFTKYDSATCVIPVVQSPDAVKATITK